MRQIRHADDRGHFDHGWLNTYHTFSFGHYVDREHMGFRTLRVINEDRVLPGRGFGMHPHENMEIITYVVDGALEHKDSTGLGSVIRAGDLQRMSAGTGIMHSEFNPSPDDPVHLYQIWLLPDRHDVEPSYETLPSAARTPGAFHLVASPDGRDGSLSINQDAYVHLATVHEDQRVEHALAPRRHAWLQVVNGIVALDGAPLAAGDGVAISDEPSVAITGGAEGSQVMVFDLT